VIRDVSFAGTTVRVEYDGDEAAAIVDFALARVPQPAAALPPHITFTLRSAPDGDLTLVCGDKPQYQGRSSGAAGRELLERLLFHLSDPSRDGLVIHAAAVVRGGECLLLPGRTGSGKTTLAAWLCQQGFEYLTDELVYIPTGSTTLQAFTRPFNLRNASLRLLGLDQEAGGAARVIAASKVSLVWPAETKVHASASSRITRIVFPKYQAHSRFEPRVLSRAETGLGLMGCLINARNLEGHGFPEVTRLSRSAPAFHVRYGDFSQMLEWIDETRESTPEG
jgi:hypothetical protein